MSEGDDKLKDLKSRLGLVSSAGGNQAPKKTEAAAAEEPAAPVQVSEDAGQQAAAPSMATPTREMSSEEMDAYESDARVDLSVVSDGKKGPTIIIGILIAIVAYGVGQFIGGNMADRSLIDRVEADTASLKGALERKNPDTGDTRLERIRAHVEATTAVASKLNAVPEGEFAQAEKLVLDYLGTCKNFEETIDFSAVLGQGFLAAKHLPQMMTLALATARYEERVKGMSKRASLLADMNSARNERYDDPNFGRKKLFVQVGSAKISQPSGESLEVPMAWGEWIKGDISGFQEFPMNPNLRKSPMEWRTKGLLLGQKEAQMLPTSQVADVDMRVFLEPLDRAGYREVLSQTIQDIEALDAFGKTLALDRLRESLGQ